MGKKAIQSAPTLNNRKASFKFELLDLFECGIVLLGTEVKSLRQGQGSLDEAYALIQGGEIWLRGFHIPPYEHGNVLNHEPTRKRKLLLHAREIKKIKPKLELRGFTLVPIKVYFNDRGLAKVTIAVARGKAHADKRDSLKKRDAKREMERAMRHR